jgi:hypothetical protein
MLLAWCGGGGKKIELDRAAATAAILESSTHPPMREILRRIDRHAFSSWRFVPQYRCAAIWAGAGSEIDEALIHKGPVSSRESFLPWHVGVSLCIFKIISVSRASEGKSYFARLFSR